MGWKDLFKKKSAPSDADRITRLTLSDLKVGYMVDYDLKSWQVTAVHHYEWGEGDRTFEWQLKSFDETIYLEKETDDEDYWTVSRKIPIGRLDPKITRHIKDHEDPPNQIVFDNTTYYLDEFGGGHFFANRREPGQELLKWDFMDDTEKKYLSIEQWSESDFAAAVGEPVEEYQFTNILPGEPEGAA